ncbi:MAG TPA: hypothetical protein VGV35_14150 [Bryobacteraceae bacterium]|nr:hypothetical protein [Bryobacteraceae bacterium]
MASPKMTFSIPKALASKFVKRVPARQRSRYVTKALASKLEERDRLLIRACETANRSRDARAMEREFDALSDEILERWNEASSR